ncbi:MAG: flavoprotein [Alistipes communis]
MKLILAVTAASGAVYARQTAERLAALDCVESVALVYSDVAPTVMAHEGVALPDHPKFVRYDNRDLFAPPASGSARYDAMIVVPCSVGTAGRIASGVSQTLIERAADVMLKERRRLILVVRENAPVAHPPAQPHGAGRVRRRRAARRTVVLRPPRRHRIALRHGHRTHRRARLPRSRALRMGAES